MFKNKTSMYNSAEEEHQTEKLAKVHKYTEKNTLTPTNTHNYYSGEDVTARTDKRAKQLIRQIIYTRNIKTETK